MALQNPRKVDNTQCKPTVMSLTKRRPTCAWRDSLVGVAVFLWSCASWKGMFAPLRTMEPKWASISPNIDGNFLVLKVHAVKISYNRVGKGIYGKDEIKIVYNPVSQSELLWRAEPAGCVKCISKIGLRVMKLWGVAGLTSEAVLFSSWKLSFIFLSFFQLTGALLQLNVTKVSYYKC